MKRQAKEQGFGAIELIIVVVIVIVIGVVGWLAFKKANIKQNAAQSASSQKANESADKQANKNTAADEAEDKPAPVQKGVIAGKASYPSEGLPEDLTICAQVATDKTEVHCKVVGTNPTIDYTMEVPPGNYYVYAKTDQNPDYKAYYNEFVTCGLSVDCPESGHDVYVLVEVKAGQTTKGINPGDWYDF